KITKEYKEQKRKKISEITQKITKEYEEFRESYLKGEPIKYPRYLYQLIKGSTNEFNEKIKGVAEKFGLKTDKILPSTIEKLHNLTQEELKPIFKIPISSNSKEIVTKEVSLTLPDGVNESLRVGMKTAFDMHSSKPNHLQEILEKLKEIDSTFAEGKEAVAERMRAVGIDERQIQAYLNGKMSEKNARSLLLKALFKALDSSTDMSMLVWEAVKHQGSEDLFIEYINRTLPKERLTEVLNKLSDIDVHLADVLSEKGIQDALPLVKLSSAYKAIAAAKTSKNEIENAEKSATRSYTLVITPNARLMDIFHGVFGGTCLGDNPAFSLARKDIATATLYQDGKPVGGVLFLLRKIENKPSLIIGGVDLSEQVRGTGKYALAAEKQIEIVDWMLSSIKKYAEDNKFGLYITSVGGISNTDIIANHVEKYFGNKTVFFKQTGKFHE
ncbi:MAG: hypothetical protein ACK4NX_02965, partial [Candidatus Paceibacteria bacterium]